MVQQGWLTATPFVHRGAGGGVVIHSPPLNARAAHSRVMVVANDFATGVVTGRRGATAETSGQPPIQTGNSAEIFGTRTEGSVMTTKLLATMMLAAVCSVTLTGCDDGTATPPTVSSTQSATTPTGSSSSTPTPTKSMTPEQQDLHDAAQAIVTYWKVLDQAASDPKANLNLLATVARAQALAQWQSTLAAYRSKGWVQSGNSTLGDVVAEKADKDTFTVTACRDATGVDVVDSSGKSVVENTRPDRQRFTYTVQKAPEGFFVTEDLFNGEPCDA